MPRASILLACAGVFAFAAAGCSGGDDVYYYNDGYGDDRSCPPGFDQFTIDSGSTLELDPGAGVGVTAEYLGKGAWRFATTCDTRVSGYACSWDILVSAVDGKIEGFDSESLEPNDTLVRSPSVEDGPDDAVRLIATSDYDLDAFTLDATPGATLDVDVLLDDQCGGTYLHWLNAGRVVQAHTQAVDLTPTAP